MAQIRRVRTIFTGVAGTPWYSNLYFSSGVGLSAQAQTDLIKAFWTDMATTMHATVRWTVQPEVTIINDANGQVEGLLAVTGGTGIGSAPTDLLPLATQGLVRLQTGVYINGRGVRGKIFIPGQVEGNSTPQGVPAPSLVTFYAATANELVNDSLDSLVVYSPTNGTSVEVETASAWTNWAVMRSRRD